MTTATISQLTEPERFETLNAIRERIDWLCIQIEVCQCQCRSPHLGEVEQDIARNNAVEWARHMRTAERAYHALGGTIQAYLPAQAREPVL